MPIVASELSQPIQIRYGRLIRGPVEVRLKNRSRYIPAIVCALTLSAALAWGQGPQAASVVPTMVRFNGVVSGTPSRIIGITFSLYKDQQGGAPLWLETQSVSLDATGHYSVQLGSTAPNGVPKDLFASGEARWLGVQPEGQSEQTRVLLLSVPYALKAADAETIGGLPPSAFVLATPAVSANGSAAPAATSGTPASLAPPPATVSGSGTANYLPLWIDSADIGNSVVFQSGTGTTAKVGINTATPTTTLDVKGASTFRGLFTLPATAIATATKGSNSQPLSMVASAFNSGTAAAVNQSFNWQAEPVGNNTSTPTASMSLLFGAGATKPAETGFKIASNGLVTFAPGQTFPGTGTISGVSVGPGLIGGGTNGEISIALTGSCGLGQVLQWTSVTWQCASVLTGVTAGTDLTASTLNGVATFNLDTTKVPQLNVANAFTASQNITGDIVASGALNGGTVNSINGYNIGGTPFLVGSTSTASAFLGFSGNSASTGTENTSVGFVALANNTTGFNNAAVGAGALVHNTTGNDNTAVGQNALGNVTTGALNTAIGFGAGPDSSHPTLVNTTAIGSNAIVSVSNALVLGGTGSSAVNVGIGTASPAFALDVHGTGNFTGPITFAAGQTFPGTGTITAVTAGSGLTGGGTTGGITLNVDATKVVSGVTAGTGLTGGGTGGVPTLNVDTTKVPLLNAANVFAGTQTVNGGLVASAGISTNAYFLNGSAFASGDPANGNLYLLLAGNSSSTGQGNYANGGNALASDTTGSYNIAEGPLALYNNTTGSSNTAVGEAALAYNSSGSYNAALGWFAGPDSSTPNLSNTTAIGAYADVAVSNAIVLGGINNINGATADTNVGIATTAPTARLHIGNSNTVASLRVEGPTKLGTGAFSGSFGGFGDFNIDALGTVGGRFTVKETGKVGVGTATPDATLSVNGTADKTGGGSWGTYSDRRLKDLDGEFSPGLDAILKLQPIRYHYKDENGMGIRDHDQHIGFVAQEVQKVIPEAVTQNDRGYLLVNNDPILWTMLNAIKEQQKQIHEQRLQISKLTRELGAVKATLRSTKGGNQPAVKLAATRNTTVMTATGSH